MVLALIILIITCLLIIASVLAFPVLKVGRLHFSTYWVVALLGAVVMLICGVVSPSTVWSNLTMNTAVNPLKILALFVSMTILSVFLDELGFFAYLAEKLILKAGKSQKRLFIYLYAVVSVLTVFTSNDIIILTFTPFICFFCKNAKINPTPYLFAEFVGGNTWSMALVIGNPTNIYLATSFGITFFEYFKVMFLPTLATGLLSLLLLYLLFRKSLNEEISTEEEISKTKIRDKFLLVIGVAALSLCIVLLAISSSIGTEMWGICVFFASALLICATVYLMAKKQSLFVIKHTIRRAPYELIPFVLSMFVVVLGVSESGLASSFKEFLTKGSPLFSYGVTSFLASNIINNIPMSVLYSSLVSSAPATYASIVGSNLGALLTPLGALAGIMWCNLLKVYGQKISFLEFTKKGIIIAIPSLIVTLLVLLLVL